MFLNVKNEPATKAAIIDISDKINTIILPELKILIKDLFVLG